MRTRTSWNIVSIHNNAHIIDHKRVRCCWSVAGFLLFFCWFVSGRLVVRHFSYVTFDKKTIFDFDTTIYEFF